MRLIILCFFSILMKIFSFLFGKFDFLLISVFLLFFLDYLTSLFLDVKENKLNKKELLIRFFKVLGYLSVIIITVIMDHLITNSTTIRDVVLTTMVCNEMIQILKNCVRLGLKIPNLLTQNLQNFVDSLNPPIIISPSEEKKKEK